MIYVQASSLKAHRWTRLFRKKFFWIFSLVGHFCLK